MAATLKVVDQYLGTGTGQRRTGMNLRLASERVTVREIIRSRVEVEVHEINLARQQQTECIATARGYLVPVEAERELKSSSAKSSAWIEPLDIDAEVDRATAAFARRRFIMLLDDREIDDLDEAVGLRSESEVVFVHLTPLKGG
jgi:hypothetical protein